MAQNLPDRPSMPFSWNETPDPLNRPDLFDGIVTRRVLAYLIDAAILLGVLGFLWLIVVITLFMLSPIAGILTPLIPLAYHTMLIGGRDSATIGMRMMGIQVRTLDGGRPDYLQAGLQTLLFYGTMALTGLLLIAALFNDRNRCLHDWLSGTVFIVDTGEPAV